jgi:hypothetical protein
MSDTQSFWSVPQRDGEPPFWVCMSCLSEAFYRKVPMPDCPNCHGVSTYEAFAIEAIADWGTEDLVAKNKRRTSNLRPHPQWNPRRKPIVKAECLFARTTSIPCWRPLAPK